MFKFEAIIHSFITKLNELLSSVQGWVIMLGCMLLNFFVNYQLAFIGVITCIFIDMFVGIWSAIKQNKYAKSELMRDTFSKIFIYCGSMVMTIFMEKLFNMGTTFITNIIAAIICATELWSIAGNALIINPRLHFFRFLRPALIGEIARKLHISEDEVKEVFKELQKEKEEKENK